MCCDLARFDIDVVTLIEIRFATEAEIGPIYTIFWEGKQCIYWIGFAMNTKLVEQYNLIPHYNHRMLDDPHPDPTQSG